LGDGSTDQSNTPVKVVFTEQEESLLDVRGSYFVTPGEEITYLVHYENIFGETLVDAVVTFDLPSDFTYLSSTNNGSYISDKHQVLWILGDINPDDIGYLAIKMGVSWGLTSHAKGELFVSLGAKNLTKGLA
nr:DUF11 domain-containing protein [Bacteroidota bacterium]